MATSNEKVSRIEFMEEMNQIGLSPNVTGKPADGLTRAEAAVFLAQALPPMNLGIAGGVPAPFHDMSSMTAEQQQAVSTLYALGIVVGDDQQMFHGNRDLTREELGMMAERTQARLQAAGGSQVTGPTKPGAPMKPTAPADSNAADATSSSSATSSSGAPIPYEVITDLSTLPPNVQDTASALQGTSGAVTVDSGDSTYLLLSAGERSTGGYAITVAGVNETDVRIEVTVGLTTPAPGTMLLQAITYPQLAVRFARTVKPIVVLNPEALSA
ncbi:protease complex subunit PrcB family protein [Tumebacillus flagellatus]|uniref:SLH domain-containing protein n=1 Tax=Tumebacillus flagellatus TaxID=1157490 RepID=A0A074LMM7_9BACL|nr:protease complex subunit PrcB family protein [Tumebacillus flagellatus]KEO81093.1 hypothetical protein EL26_22620 [Tumebacillus flagellatus]